MRLGKDLINKPIYSIDEGKLLGKVQDLYFDSTYEVILGLYIGSQGLVRRKAELIRAGDVAIYGADTVLVYSSGAVTDDGALPEAKSWMRRDKLVGREVDSPAGTRLGIVGDVVIDAAGRVTAFALSRTFVEGPLAAKRVIDRATIVDTGQEDGKMTVDLVKLEAALINAEAAPEPVEEGLAELPIVVEGDEDTPAQ